MHRTVVLLLGLLATIPWSARPASAQGEVGGGLARFSGEIGSYAEANAISGAERRRPAATGRLYFRPSVVLAGRFTVAFDFLLSSESRSFQSSSRQSLNQYGINPRWGWGGAHLGDFSDSYSPLTFSGVKVRGAGLDVTRGWFWASAFGGRTERAVQGGATNGRFERNMFGGRIGVGNPRGSSIGLSFVRARDNVNSLTLPGDTLVLPPTQPDTAFVEDTLQVGQLANPFAVTPQENLVVGLAGTLALFGDAFQLKTELSGGGHTRDLRSDVIDSPDILSRIPGIARSVFTPRVSSVADFALSVETTTRVGPLSATATFRNIGPGYTSLGVGSLQNDLREAGLRTQLRFRRWNVRVDGARQHDNLVGQKTLTTNRDRLAASLSVRPGRTWNASLTTQYSRLGNNAPQREQLIAYTSLMVGTNQTITFSRRGLLRNASVQYQFRSTGDDNPMRVQSTSRSHSVNARLLLSPARILNVTPTVGIVRSRFAEMGWSTRQTYSLGAQLRVMNGKLMSAFQLGRSQINQTTATQFSANARYQLTRHDMLILSVRASDFANALEASRNFQEGQVSLRWSRRL